MKYHQQANTNCARALIIIIPRCRGREKIAKKRKLRECILRVAVITITASHQSRVWEKDDGKTKLPTKYGNHWIIQFRRVMHPSISSSCRLCAADRTSNNHKWSFFSVDSCVWLAVHWHEMISAYLILCRVMEADRALYLGFGCGGREKKREE